MQSKGGCAAPPGALRESLLWEDRIAVPFIHDDGRDAADGVVSQLRKAIIQGRDAATSAPVGRVPRKRLSGSLAGRCDALSGRRNQRLSERPACRGRRKIMLPDR